MEREGVPKVPSYFYYLDGNKVDEVLVHYANAIEAAIIRNLP